MLHGLKPFQRATVDHVFHHMYERQPFSRRFLVADEVGLGKTLVARGVMARIIDKFWEKMFPNKVAAGFTMFTVFLIISVPLVVLGITQP